MNLELTFYVMDVLHTLNCGAGAGLFISLGVWGICSIFCWGEEIEINPRLLIFLKTSSIVCTLLAIFIPTKDTMNKIIITHYLKQSELPEKALKLIEKYINKELEKLK